MCSFAKSRPQRESNARLYRSANSSAVRQPSDMIAIPAKHINHGPQRLRDIAARPRDATRPSWSSEDKRLCKKRAQGMPGARCAR